MKSIARFFSHALYSVQTQLCPRMSRSHHESDIRMLSANTNRSRTNEIDYQCDFSECNFITTVEKRVLFRSHESPFVL